MLSPVLLCATLTCAQVAPYPSSQNTIPLTLPVAEFRDVTAAEDTPPLVIPAPIATPSPVVLPAPPAAALVTPPDRWLLMKELQGTWPGALLDGNRMRVYGWTEGSYTYGSDGRGASPMPAQSPTNGFLLNQNWLVVERTVVTTGTTEPTFGFSTAWDLPGSDSRYTISRHLLNRQDGVGDLTTDAYPIDLYHAYGEAYIPTVGLGLDVKVGKNAVSYFAETEEQVNNPLYSHSYIFYYGGPFTHTGLQANLKLTDEWSVEARVVTGDDITFGPGEQATFVGGLQWTQSGGRNTALLSVVAGSGRYDERDQQNNLNLIDLVYTHTFNPVLKYTLDAVGGYETNVSSVTRNGADNATWFGAAQYLTYALSPRLSATARLEFFDDPQGLRTGFTGLYNELTAGLTFKARSDLWIRPELRYDYNANSRPFDNDHDPQHGQLSLATDVILRW